VADSLDDEADQLKLRDIDRPDVILVAMKGCSGLIPAIQTRQLKSPLEYEVSGK